MRLPLLGADGAGELFHRPRAGRVLLHPRDRVRHQCVFVGNGVDTVRFHPVDHAAARQKYGLPMGAKVLVSVDQVNVKAKSGELVGPIGRGEAISADAVVLLLKAPK